ncbi:MAG: hypothetical protein DI537_13710 [Stutzerimonas stutzeri]|nr:MAG: hypothetical protein DI537_13710 [Stutzerimonas stutzeri]
MIAEYDASGRIFHIVNDPVPAGLVERLTEMQATFLDLPPEPLPDMPELGADGEPIYDYETTPLFEEDGVTPRLDANGEHLHEVRQKARMITGRSQSVAVSFDQNYVLQGELAERPKLPVPAQIVLTRNQTHSIDDLPDGCVVKFAGESVPVTNGAMDIEGEEVGTFVLQFECWPYQPTKCEVIVNEA